MWARTQLKIGWCDLMYAGTACFSGRDRTKAVQNVETYWGQDDDTIATYSVRSGFDLLLQALELDEGDEIIFSALNIKGMVKVVRRLGLVPVPADLDIDYFGPRLETLEAAISPKSKVLVLAHLFGTRLDMAPIVAFARKHNLILVEDLAQAFDGHAYPGEPKADIKMYSFGPLKTATALSGALIRVNDEKLRNHMREMQAAYPVQSNFEQLKRVLKFSGLKVISSRPVMEVIYRGFQMFGRDYQDGLIDQVRGVAKLGSSARLRFQPSAAALKLMARRIHNHRQGALNERTEQGVILCDLLKGAVVMPGLANKVHSYWIFTMIVDEPHAFIKKLRAQGFDCGDMPRSQAVKAPADRPEISPIVSDTALKDMIMVPCYPGMPESELVRLADAIKKIAEETGTKRTKTYARTLEPVNSPA